jgi:hypothetical protein
MYRPRQGARSCNGSQNFKAPCEFGGVLFRVRTTRWGCVSMKIASYNVENLFERAVALSTDDAAGRAAIDAHGEINGLLRKAKYDDADRMIVLIAEGVGASARGVLARFCWWCRRGGTARGRISRPGMSADARALHRGRRRHLA